MTYCQAQSTPNSSVLNTEWISAKCHSMLIKPLHSKWPAQTAHQEVGKALGYTSAKLVNQREISKLGQINKKDRQLYKTKCHTNKTPNLIGM